MAAVAGRIVGSMVEAKACHVMNLAECLRRYGLNSKTKRVQGIMTHVEVIKNLTTNRMTTFVMAAYDLGGMMIRPCRLNIRSVKAVLTPTAATVTTAGGALLGSTDGDSTTTEVMTPPAATEPTLEAPTNADTSSEEPTVVVNGNYHFCNWAIKTRMGYMLGRGGDHQNSYSCLEYFLMLFPPEQL